MSSGGGGLEGGGSFESVDDVFLAGLASWDELSSIQAPLIPVNAGAGGGGSGISSVHSLSEGRMESFLSEEDMYPGGGDLPKAEEDNGGEEEGDEEMADDLSLCLVDTQQPTKPQTQIQAESMVQGRGQGHGVGQGQSQTDIADKKRKRAVLSKEERAKQNRDRNREHARNTRLRKKAYVEELKKQVEELAAGKEKEERDRKTEARRETSLKDMRFQVLQTFLDYRGRGESGSQAWQGVVEEDFEMRLPLTPYRSFPPQQVQEGVRVIQGLDNLLADTVSLKVTTEGAHTAGGARWGKRGMAVGNKDGKKEKEAISTARLVYVVDGKDLMVKNDTFMCPFHARSPQLSVPGMLRCTFSKSNRLLRLEMSFDARHVAMQLASSGIGGVTEMQAGTTHHTRGGITAAALNKEIEGASSVDNDNDGAVLRTVVEDLRAWRVSSTVINDPEAGKSYLRVYPLDSETTGVMQEGVTHFIGVLESVDNVNSVPTAEVGAGEEEGGLKESSRGSSSEGETSSDSVSGSSSNSRTAGQAELSPQNKIAGWPDSGSSDGKQDSGSEDCVGGPAESQMGRNKRSNSMTQSQTTTTSDGGSSTSSSRHSRGIRRSAKRSCNTTATESGATSPRTVPTVSTRSTNSR